MRFCYLLRYCPTQTETFVYREASGLISRGHQVRAVAWEPREDGDELPAWELRYPPGRAGLLHLLPRLGRTEWLLRYQRPKRVLQALWFAEQLSDEECVHAHFAGEAAEWARLAWLERQIPYGVTVHAVDLYKPRPGLKEVLTDARVVLTVSRYNATLLRQRYGIEARVVRCGVRPLAPSDPRVGGVVSVARDVPKKGLDLLRAACAELGVEPELVGAEGPRPFSEVRAALHRACLFALPCREAPDGDRDGIPVALMEAMSAGLPVLTTSLEGISELVDETVGWVVPPEDPSALAEALREALSCPEERLRRGRAARERVRAHWSLDAQVEGLLEAWA